MKTLPPRLIAAAILALLAIGLVIKASPWPSFARFPPAYFEADNLRQENTAATSALPQSSADDSDLKAGGYFTIYRNDRGEAVCRASTAAEVRQMDVNARELRLHQINHAEINSPEAKNDPMAAGSGLIIILRAAQQLQQNPTAVAAFTRAAQNWEALVMSPVTIYIDVDFGTTFFGQTFPSGVLGATSAPSSGYSYESARTNLVAEAVGEGNATKQAVMNALPSTTVPTDLGASSSTVVSDPAARALGLLPATAGTNDPAAKIGFNSNFNFDFDPTDGITSGQIDFDAVATHEIGHALGFHSEEGVNLPRPAVWDLYRFRTGTTAGTFTNAQRILTIGGSPDPLQYFFLPGNNELGLSTGGPSGSFTNGGDGWQSSHWKHSTSCTPYIGIMDPAIGSGCRRMITSNDTLALSYFGYNLTNNNSPPLPPPAPTPPGNDNFANAQTISGCSGSTTGTSFGAASEIGEPSHDPLFTSSLSPGHTVWYQWQAPSSVSTTITTQGSEFDTLLAVYTGFIFGSLTRVAFNDDVQDGVIVTSSVTFRAMAGTTYRIAVDGWAGDAGGILLNWNGCPAPTCPTALTLNDNGDGGDAAPGDNVCATVGGSCTLRAAIQEINALSSCDTIDINFSGVTGAISLNTALPEIQRNLRINGPGTSLLTIQRSAAANTPSFRVFSFGTGSAASISGVTISNGNVSNAVNGAGVLNRGTLAVTNTVITGNTATPNGWAIYNESILNITNTSVINNPGGGFGNGGTATMTASTISGNSNTIGGAGINSGGNLTVLDSTITNNTSTTLEGGGILIGSGIATLLNSTVSGNVATQSGGGGVYNRGTVSVINSSISGNSAPQGGGGGIYNFEGTLTLTNSTVTANTALHGGGVEHRDQTVNIKNTIIAGNTLVSGTSGPDLLGTFNSQDYNLIGNSSGATFTGTATHNIVNINALLGPLANNGGPTMTHGFLAGSPAINAGSNALAVDYNGSALMTDQRGAGFSRVSGGTVDIGAFELQSGEIPPPPPPTPTPTPTPQPTPTPSPCLTLVVNSNGDSPDVTAGDGLCATASGSCTLRAAIQEANARTTCGTIDINLSAASPITLNTQLPDVNHNVNFNGPGANNLTVQRNVSAAAFRIFTIQNFTVNISGITISNGNFANRNTGSGVYNAGTLALTNTVISGNAFGGIWNNRGTLTLTNSSVNNNSFLGIENDGTLTLTNSTVRGNGGSGIYNLGPLVVINSTISGNSSLDNGGGIRNAGSESVTLLNSTLSGNSAVGVGGCISNESTGGATLTNVTVANNRSNAGDNVGRPGGGIFRSSDFSTGSVTLKNTIVAGNFRGSGSIIDDVNGAITASSSFNLIGDVTGLTGISNGSNGNQIGNSGSAINAMLGSLANNGGPTTTHALLSGSPAINAGSNALAVESNGNPLNTDQRGVGFGRIVNGFADIGAFEFTAPPHLFTDSSNRVVVLDSVTFIRDPFAVLGIHNFSLDQRTRVMIFTSNLGLNQPSADLSVTAGAIPLTVEGVGTLPGVPDKSYVIVKLDPMLTGNVSLTVTFHGVASNVGILTVSP